MKVLATTPVKYGDPIFIAEITSDELACLVSLSNYSEVTAKAADGKIVSRKIVELQAGDAIDSSLFKAHSKDAYSMRSAREDISKASATMRGALTKLLNSLPKEKES